MIYKRGSVYWIKYYRNGRPYRESAKSSQFWRVYQECCKRMSKRDALVFSMREVMGLSSEEICKKTEITTTNLHVILFRARLSLRSCMSENWFGNQQGSAAK